MNLQDRTAVYRAGVINDMVKEFHNENMERGWWLDSATSESIHPSAKTGHFAAEMAQPYVIATKLALVMTEISEAIEAYRTDAMDDKIPARPGCEVEIADGVIRLFDICGALGYDLGGAIMEKRAFNAVRADHDMNNRAKAGGKKF